MEFTVVEFALTSTPFVPITEAIAPVVKFVPVISSVPEPTDST